MSKDLLPDIPNYRGLLAPGNLDSTAIQPEGMPKQDTYIVQMGKNFVLLPADVGGSIVDPKTAEANFLKTRNHLGVFNSRDDANSYLNEMYGGYSGSTGSSLGDAIQDFKGGKPTKVQPSFADPEDPETVKQMTDMYTPQTYTNK